MYFLPQIRRVIDCEFDRQKILGWSSIFWILRYQQVSWVWEKFLLSACFVADTEKVMASIFRDAESKLMVNYLRKGQTVHVAYYDSLLWQLREKIKLKRRGMLRRGVLFHHQNAPVHKSVSASMPIMNVALNLFITHRILLIWLLQTSICLQTWKDVSQELIIILIMMSYLPWLLWLSG